jgi:hypothetical protein
LWKRELSAFPTPSYLSSEGDSWEVVLREANTISAGRETPMSMRNFGPVELIGLCRSVSSFLREVVFQRKKLMLYSVKIGLLVRGTIATIVELEMSSERLFMARR